MTHLIYCNGSILPAGWNIISIKSSGFFWVFNPSKYSLMWRGGFCSHGGNSCPVCVCVCVFVCVCVCARFFFLSLSAAKVAPRCCRNKPFARKCRKTKKKTKLILYPTHLDLMLTQGRFFYFFFMHKQGSKKTRQNGFLHLDILRHVCKIDYMDT